MSFIDDEYFIQNFLTNGSHKSFRKGIRVGGLVRDANDVDTFGLEHVIKRLGKLLVIVPNQATEFIFLILYRPDLISSLLSDPVTVGVVGNASQVNLPGADVNEEENGQGFEPDRFYLEEIAGQ